MEQKQISSEYTHVVVGGTSFLLDAEVIEKLGSNFLSSVIYAQSEYHLPGTGTYTIDADPECFSAFIHFTRYGSIPESYLDKEKKQQMVNQAGFWGIRAKVVQKLRDLAAAKKREEDKITDGILEEVQKGNVLRDLSEAFEKVAMSKMHHNHRENDVCGRVYCTLCGNKDIDAAWYSGDGSEKYISCYGCKKDIMYQSNLGWCHQCSLCIDCQGPECEANRHVSASLRSYSACKKIPTTKELEEKAKKTLLRTFNRT
mmetsp:Transcript_13759/g.17360  ORF Transcript_13759/g.17360 Transcript_13759/m.17360 type:complete len:257 (+) Transcript_13759:83-853(+)